MKEFYAEVFNHRVGLPNSKMIQTINVMPYILLIPKGMDYDQVEAVLQRIGINYWKWTEEPLSQVIDLEREERYALGRLYPKHRHYRRSTTPQRKPKSIKQIHSSYVIAHFGVPGDHKGCIHNLSSVPNFGTMTLLETLIFDIFVRWIHSKKEQLDEDLLRTLPLRLPSELGTLCTGTVIDNKKCVISVQHKPQSNKLFIRAHRREKSQITVQPRQVARIL